MSFLCESEGEPLESQVLEFINSAHPDKLPVRMLSSPKADSIYLFKNDGTKDINVDGYKWHQSSKYKAKGSSVTVTRFYAVQSREKTSREISSSFKKVKFIVSDSTVGLLYYGGDPNSVIRKPHGNSHSSRIFYRTLPSTIEKIKEFRNSNSIVKDYGDITREIKKAEIFDSNKEEKSFLNQHVLPRNIKQIKNFKLADASNKNLHHDEFYSLYLLAKTEMSKTIRYIAIFPDIVIVCGLPGAISLANRLLSDVKQSENNQCFTYDTTFNLSNMFASFLVMRNTEINGDPIFPVLMMLHSSKNHLSILFFGKNLLLI